MDNDLPNTKGPSNDGCVPLDDRTANAILSAVASLHYGVVEVVVHNGRVVQIDKRERIRLTLPE